MSFTCDILGLGVCAIDDITYVETYPPPNTKMRALRRERHCGGLTMTALVAAARLGARCAYAGQLGDDAHCRIVIEMLQRENIDTQHIVHVPEARPVLSTIIVGAAGGTRNIFPLHAEVDGAHPSLPTEDIIRSARVLFVDAIGIDGQIRAAQIARAHSIPVVGDIESDKSPRFHELFALTNHLIVSEDFAYRITQTANAADAVEKLFTTSNRALVAVTCGAQGCWFRFDGDVGEVRHMPAFPVNVVDTTGCGDVFHGAYAAALAQGLPPVERIRWAAAAAAIKATQAGGQAGAPTRTAVETFLRVGIQ